MDGISTEGRRTAVGIQTTPMKTWVMWCARNTDCIIVEKLCSLLPGARRRLSRLAASTISRRGGATPPELAQISRSARADDRRRRTSAIAKNTRQRANATGRRYHHAAGPRGGGAEPPTVGGMRPDSRPDVQGQPSGRRTFNNCNPASRL